MEEEDDVLDMQILKQRRQTSTRPLTLNELETLLKNSTDASNVLLRIAKNDGCLERLLQEEDGNPRKTELTVKVLCKALKNPRNVQRQGITDVLCIFKDAPGFRDKIADSLLHMRLRSDEEYVKSVLFLLEKSAEVYANIAAKAFSHIFLLLENVIDVHHERNETLQENRRAVKKLLQQPYLLAKAEEEQERQHANVHNDGNVDPNLFRGLSIIPNDADFDPAQDLLVRHNKIVGAYENVNDYLDIQFRLLRADLILPLRENILRYLDGEDRRELAAIRIYHQVRIVRPICHDKGLCFRLSFDVSKLRHVNWCVSARLKYGSLLCLSRDSFLTFQFAVVENSEPKELSKGLVDVQFILAANGVDVNVGGHEEFMQLVNSARDVRFQMAESPTYFEAYRHVLAGLQQITENNFPFWRYIGQCDPDVQVPAYLQNWQNATFDLRPLIDTSYIIKDNENEENQFNEESAIAAAVNILDHESWPTANTFDLDNSQLVALQSALTKELCIIQGPPGTGKTHLGLLILKALLHNKQAWTGDAGPTPILLVCYTNHALDQFLEGILKFFVGKLIRVGSRSKSEVLEEYNLRGMRNRARENRAVPVDIHLARHQVRIEMKELKADIHKEATKLEILEREIVKESFLKCVMNEKHFDSLANKSPKGILNWLGIHYHVRRIENAGMPERQRQGVRQAGPQNFQPAEVADEAAVGNDDEEMVDDGDDDDIDLLDIVNAEATYLGIDDDDDEDDLDEEDEIFRELMPDGDEGFLQNIRNVNKKLDEADIESARIRRECIAFNISEYGEEPVPQTLSKEEKAHWKSLVPRKKRYRTQLLNYLQRLDKMTEDEVSQIYNIRALKKPERWRLYRYWIDLYSRQIRGEIRDKSQLYEQKARRYQEILHQEDKTILEKATIIGMTTTGAARYQGILHEIGPKIVLVEEAAEVLEGHVITSLSDRCQHVVLIGDHKQLRPNPSVYELKKKYDLDVSLFERLLKNNFPCDCLMYQHRMRPEISRLLHVEDLYPKLRDHDIVREYPNVMRVKGNVRFIQHYELEEEEGDTRTFVNKYEAKFLIGLCEYLLQQGQFTSKQITILSPYAGQIHYIRNNLEALVQSQATLPKIKGLKVSSVDNYQGEENEIILLSLVRSNADNDIGFLKVNNRICVALSRAKIGLYVIGNFAGLAERSSLMHDVICEAKRCGYVGDHITLNCLRHPRMDIVIKSPKDFRRVPEGGCSEPCGMRLNCGHSCKRVCHADDWEHKNFPCRDKCRYKCEKCGQHCTQDHFCGEHDQCGSLVEKVIPTCGHVQRVPCHMEPNLFECEDQCKTLLPCGHQCPGKCGKRHEHNDTTCREIIEVTPEFCGHDKFQIECRLFKDGDSNCPEPCDAILKCEHKCAGTCGKCFGGRLHVDCLQRCQKILICGHPCHDTCNSCPPCMQPCETECCHSRCPRKCGELCTSCVEPCPWECKHESCQELCCQPCVRPPCDVQCPKRLPCGHICCGLCGEKCPRLCSVCDKEELINISLYGYDGDPTTLFVELDCGHVVEVDFMDQWMVTSTATDEGSDQQAIALKTCPLCKSPVRKCSRYNHQIKKMLRLIESVKRKYIGGRQAATRRHLDQILRTVGGQDRIVIDNFLQEGKYVPSEITLEAQVNQINLYRQIRALRQVTLECQNRWEHRANTLREINLDLDHFSKWVLRHRATFSEQNIQDAELECDRLSLLINLHRVEFNVSSRGFRETLPPRLLIQLGQSIKALSSHKKSDEKVIQETKDLCEEFKKHVPDSHIALTAEEKMEIVRAVNVSRGAWYQCPNGHIYAIGECGQAMEEATCPECKERIGGINHTLLQGNAQAPEMDKAEHPIWNNIEADRQLADMLQRELNA